MLLQLSSENQNIFQHMAVDDSPTWKTSFGIFCYTILKIEWQYRNICECYKIFLATLLYFDVVQKLVHNLRMRTIFVSGTYLVQRSIYVVHLFKCV